MIDAEARPNALLVEHALLITMADGEAPFVGWFTVDPGGRIVEVGAGDPPAGIVAESTFDAAGRIVAPGFVSSHSHLVTSACRGLAANEPLYPWAAAMSATLRRAAHDDIYWLMLHGSVDALNNGITTVFDFPDNRLQFLADGDGASTYGGDLLPVSYLNRQLDGRIDAGIRGFHGIMLDEAIGTDDEVIERFADAVRDGQRFGDDDRYLGTALAGSVQWAESRRSAELEAEVMRRFGVLNQTHFLETPFEVDAQLERFAWHDEEGMLGEQLIFGHFVHATTTEIARAGETGCRLSWQPSANGRLGSGVAPVAECRRHGMLVGIGTDDQACTDSADPFQNMRMGLFTQRMAHQDARTLATHEVLAMHTIDAARVLGVGGDLGSLEPGKLADFVVVDPRRPDTGPIWDTIGTYVLACGLRNLTHVFVGGELVSCHGEHVRWKQAELGDAVRAAMQLPSNA